MALTYFANSGIINYNTYPLKTGGDLFNINGGTLLIDSHTRVGSNTSAANGTLGNITISPTLGGKLLIDGRKSRLLAYNTGSGTIPVPETVISSGSANGQLVAVYSAVNAANSGIGTTVPSAGFILLRNWNGVEFSAGALTGITATANGASTTGWVEVVGDEASTINVARLGSVNIYGEWIDLGTTSGVNTTTYQIPTGGNTIYVPGVWVETAVGSGKYEFYPNAGSLTALAANIATDSVRGKVCWITAATGLLRFQSDGTNTTGGYLPVAGLDIRIPNIFTISCTTAARATNALPNATLATRYDFTGSGAVVDIDKANVGWYLSFAQPYSVQLANTGTFEQILLSELAAPVKWNQVGVGQCAAQAQFALSLTTCLAGGTIANSVFSTATLAAAGRYVFTGTDVAGFNFNDVKSFSLVARGNATTGNATWTRLLNSSFTRCRLATGRQLLTTCSNITYNNTTYWDHPATTTATTNPMYLFDLASFTTTLNIDGVDFGGLDLVQPYSGIINTAAAGCAGVTVRNLGSYQSPLNLGSTERYGQTWSRTTTTATVTTQQPHNLKTGDIIWVIQSSDIAAIVVGTKTLASAPTTTTFTFTCLNAGSAAGNISYVPTMSGYLAVFAANAVASNYKFQRCYTKNTRTSLMSSDNSSKNIVFENCMGDYFTSAFITASLNMTSKGIHAVHQMTAQANPVYGSHWFDTFTGENSANTIIQPWSRTTTTANVTSIQHKLRTGELINVINTTAQNTIPLGIASITVVGNNFFTITANNAFDTAGNITYKVMNGRIGLLMNEASAETSSQVTFDSGNPGFTAAGGLAMPFLNDQVTFEMPGANRFSTGSGGHLLGHTEFAIAQPIMAGGAIENYNAFYAIDKNDGLGYSAFKNLWYRRSGASGTIGSNTITVTDATGINANDYIFGTGIANTTYVKTVGSANTLYLSANNLFAVTGNVFFNQLPQETVSASNGFKLKFRLKTTQNNSSSITSYFVYTHNTETSRTYQYTLDTVNLTLTGLIANSDINIMQAGTTTQLLEVDQNPTSSYTWTYDSTYVGTSIDIGIMINGYVPYYIRNYTLGSTDASLPIAQVIDRNFV